VNFFSFFIAGRYSQPYLNRGLTAFLSLVSLLGLALAVFSLIVVMSVMNGFEKELQSRMLTLIPHVQLPVKDSQLAGSDAPIASLTQSLNAHPMVTGAAPYLEDTVILGRADRIFSATLLGIDPATEHSLSQLPEKLVAGDLLALEERGYGIVIGRGLAQHLDVFPGDKIDVTLPRVFMTPFGPVTRQKRFTVAGIFEVGSELDMNLVMISLQNAKRLLGRTGSIDGIRLTLENPYKSSEAMKTILADFSDQPDFSNWFDGRWIDWREKNRALYNAVIMEKMMIFTLLMAVVAVATFNVVSIILMTATNKSGDIAILKTMGATARQIRQLFILQGSLIGLAGTFAGCLAGVVIAPRIGTIVSHLERLSGQVLFDPSIYYIPYLPSVLNWTDVVIVCSISVLLSILVTLVPAMRASRIAPVIALKEYI